MPPLPGPVHTTVSLARYQATGKDCQSVLSGWVSVGLPLPPSPFFLSLSVSLLFCPSPALPTVPVFLLLPPPIPLCLSAPLPLSLEWHGADSVHSLAPPSLWLHAPYCSLMGPQVCSCLGNKEGGLKSDHLAPEISFPSPLPSLP
uniref:Uncharacterized protein n=1 Tax=Rousettus aegyptiacus TaxID=9407 RepID=A0A7J8JGF2_ROUAE|nr:hypothetical protein HJG63_010255 [Rousettus aegyptiacus]